MRIHVADHPLVAHKLTTLRDARTDSPTFRRLADELVTLLAYEATRDVRVEPVPSPHRSPRPRACKLASPRPLVVPILRAGLGMLDGMMRLLPTAEVGFLGMVRDEETLEAVDVRRRACRTTCPAARATCSTRCSPPAGRWRRRSASWSTAAPTDVTAICLLAAPEGFARLEEELAELDVPVTVVTAALDERLNEKGYIVPGLGDAGDRLYGVVG